ncbi:MAG TPA: type I-C CRISPR-associated protein Cas8c/Csd1 [Candidatus Hydrogenedentes bacterium]|nr:MAG: CRISPR-associated protein (Cas_Csd1) [Candidatus Hydrogenedentes bacterium ADurb.Bin179]HOC70134.1 type I-C CRISPR-associated protein Cas8c/Csd1 [Candidatus Hydrogenedentota bacterium]
MILQALKEYYDRKAADPESQMAPPGFEWKEIPYIVVLDTSGSPVSLDCTYEGMGKTRRAKKFLVPQAEKRASNIKANLLWDNPEYAFGVDLKGKPDRVAVQHDAFIQRVADLGNISDQGLDAVRNFLTHTEKVKVVQIFEETWKKLLDEGANVSFQLCGDTSLICERKAVRNAIQTAVQRDDAEHGVCLVTGEYDVVERLHSPIKGVWGAQTTGANIVSFNLDAFRSFAKDQGANAPVGKGAAFAYTTALNHLLNKDSKQRMQVGDASTVFWSARPSFLEDHLIDFFGEPPKDDPDRNTRAVADLFNAVRNGTLPESDRETQFYVLGLAPNASRLAIRFWISATVISMAAKICRHFEDLQLVHGPRDPDALPIFRLLVSTATAGKSENIPPNLAGDTMRAILQGLPYPKTLLQASIRRIRAEHDVTYPRAALIKACINRTTRNSTSTKERELAVSLDEYNTNIGYRLGRLFAVLEKVQQEANPGINATIRDRFYGAASGTPVAVFANLMRLKNHHLAKMESAGRRVQFEKLIGAIMEGIGDFSPHLSLADQGRFAIGYYHQMQDFYTKKSDKSE